MMNRDEYRQMLLAGAVSFPATFPQVGRLSLCAEPRPGQTSEQLEILAVEEFPSPRVTLSRRMLLSCVRAVFLPRNASAVHFSDGDWLLEGEIGCGLRQRLAASDSPLFGIVFVPETAPSILHVTAGMTAAESSQYYPPLPGDPSHNHYNPWPSNSAYASGLNFACSSSDNATILMQACSSIDPPWELERAEPAPIRSASLREITAAVGSESLMSSCTISHVGLPTRTDLQPHSPAAACTPAYPFPTDDLQP